jgi:hypothetical protein
VSVEPVEPHNKDVAALGRVLLQTAFAVTYVEFVNTIAGALGRRFPNLRLGAHIYGANAAMAPQDCPDLADNVLLTVSHQGRDPHLPLAGYPKSPVNLSMLARDVTWQQKTPNIVINEMFTPGVEGGTDPPSDTLVRDLSLLRRLRFAEIELDCSAGQNPYLDALLQ